MKNRTLPLLGVLLLARVAAAADWPQWRGPDRTDVSKETGLLKEWPKEGPKLLWQIKDAGDGYSTPSVAGGRFTSRRCQFTLCAEPVPKLVGAGLLEMDEVGAHRDLAMGRLAPSGPWLANGGALGGGLGGLVGHGYSLAQVGTVDPHAPGRVRTRSFDAGRRSPAGILRVSRFDDHERRAAAGERRDVRPGRRSLGALPIAACRCSRLPNESSGTWYRTGAP